MAHFGLFVSETNGEQTHAIDGSGTCCSQMAQQSSIFEHPRSLMICFSANTVRLLNSIFAPVLINIFPHNSHGFEKKIYVY